MTTIHAVGPTLDQHVSNVALRCVAIEALLAEKGLPTADAQLLDLYQHWLEPA